MDGIFAALTKIAVAALVTYFILVKVLGLFGPVSFAALVGS